MVFYNGSQNVFREMVAAPGNERLDRGRRWRGRRRRWRRVRTLRAVYTLWYRQVGFIRSRS